MGQQEEARRAYQSAVTCKATRERIGQARLYRKIAETMEEPGRHEEMLSNFRMAEAQKQAQTALEMGQPLLLFPFQWTSLLPLLGVALAEARDADAVTYGRLLLSPTQQRLPDALTTVLEVAVQAWDAGQPETARSHMQQAIALAMELGYL